MSLYADYIKERNGDEIVESEIGFASFRYLNETQVYIIDIYIKPQFRKARAASTLADMIIELAKVKGCKELLGSVVPSSKSATDSLKVLLGYGMSIQSASAEMIIFKKDI